MIAIKVKMSKQIVETNLKDVHAALGHHGQRGQETDEAREGDENGSAELVFVPVTGIEIDNHRTHALDGDIP